MQDDDLYRNDGTFLGGVPTEPLDQQIARKKEHAQTLETVNVLKELLTLYDKDIAFYGSVDSIPEEVKADPEMFLRIHNANELVRDALQSKKEYLESLIDSHVKNQL